MTPGAAAVQAAVSAGGLRERKRRRTRDAVTRAALELFDRQGFRATTLAQIAAAADVAPRTVSGHFPTKEALAFPHADEELASLTEHLEQRPAGETATAALRRWIGAWLPEANCRHAELTLQRRVLQANPELRAYQHTQLMRAQQPIAAAFARDLGCDADDLEPRMAAAATLTVFEVLGDHWKQTSAAGDDLDPVLAAVDRVLRFIEGGAAALGEPA